MPGSINRTSTIASAPATAGVRRRYEALIADGTIARDAAQERVVEALDSLADRITHVPLHGETSDRSSAPDQAPRGLYIHGPVGGGKTMLLDLFFASIDIGAKRWVYFHEFMAGLHERLHNERRPGETSQAGDPTTRVVRRLASEIRLLCFDEIAVTDIAEAMILSRVFSQLFSHGVIIVATSNVEPQHLYDGGINRTQVLPFVALLQENLDIVRMETRADFRLEKPQGERVWFAPADAAAKAELDRAFDRLTAGAVPQTLILPTQGHPLRVPRQAQGVARFSFRELCLDLLWTSDYLAIARTFHTLVVDAIPTRFTHRNHAKRLCALVNILYEHNVRLIVSADGEPSDIHSGMVATLNPAIGSAIRSPETTPEMLEFRRTASRLAEMRSAAYPARR